MSQVFACLSIMMFATDSEVLNQPFSIWAWEDDDSDDKDEDEDDFWEEE